VRSPRLGGRRLCFPASHWSISSYLFSPLCCLALPSQAQPNLQLTHLTQPRHDALSPYQSFYFPPPSSSPSPSCLRRGSGSRAGPCQSPKTQLVEEKPFAQAGDAQPTVCQARGNSAAPAEVYLSLLFLFQLDYNEGVCDSPGPRVFGQWAGRGGLLRPGLCYRPLWLGPKRL
jgi:hypothetical protein